MYNDERDCVRSFYDTDYEFMKNICYAKDLCDYSLLAFISTAGDMSKFLAFHTPQGKFCTFESNGRDEPIKPGSIRTICFSDGPDFMGLPSDCAPIHFLLDPNFADDQTKLLTLGWKTVR